jgi:hypothetical protein
MIKLAGSAPCSGVTVENDPWIPLKITWLPRPSGRPLYLRLSGENGGEVELKVDEVSGCLVQMIVIDDPPTAPPPIENVAPSFPESLVPVFDLVPWRGVNDRGSVASDSGRHLVSISVEMGCWRKPDRIGIVFSASDVQSVLGCEGVLVGVSKDGDLVEVISAR